MGNWISDSRFENIGFWSTIVEAIDNTIHKLRETGNIVTKIGIVSEVNSNQYYLFINGYWFKVLNYRDNKLDGVTVSLDYISYTPRNIQEKNIDISVKIG